MFNLDVIKPIVGRAGLQLQKHSPEILTAVGILGGITAGVLASRATLKVSDILGEHKATREAIRDTAESDKYDEYSDEDAKQDVVKLYLQTGVKLVKLYGPSITLAVASIGCIVSAHGIMKRRNVALAAAYKAVESAFSEYRKRVQEQLGDEGEENFRLNRYEEVIRDEETGEEQAVTMEHLGCSPYAKFFDQLSSQWQKNADYNLHFLKTQESIFNDLLNSRGHVFLNEVYDALDIPRTSAGQTVGWVRNSKNGDSFVSFGIYDLYNDEKRAFVNGYERSILLDFNVDGVILDLI